MPRSSAMGPLVLKLRLNGLKQLTVENGGLLAGEDLTLVSDLSDVEAVAQQVGEGPASKRNGADRASTAQRPHPRGDALRPQIGEQQIETAEFEIAVEDVTYRLGFLLKDGDLRFLA